PSVVSLSPRSAPAGGPAFTLTVDGSGFAAGASVQWNGAARPTTVVSPTRVTASIAAADIATVGTVTVRVVNPGPSTSNAATVTDGEHDVKAEYYERGGLAVAQASWSRVAGQTPTLGSLSPSSAAAGGPAFTLTATGTNFVTGSTLLWNGAAQPTTFVSATQL